MDRLLRIHRPILFYERYMIKVTLEKGRRTLLSRFQRPRTVL